MNPFEGCDADYTESNAAALNKRFSADYPDLRRIAQSRLRRDGGSVALETTALVNECYLKLRSSNQTLGEDRLAFLAYASRTMRSIIIDLVRESQAQRRGGEYDVVTLNTALIDSTPDATSETLDLFVLNSALDALAVAEPRLAQVVEMRYFGGLELTEIAELFDCSERTVRRDWDKAKLLLAAILA
ncbi:MAG: sigma-70 family RNA polymerase sigma factor [Burkholderiales bacterium]|nr:MAG: sigma-70 family RNA polymerase sigma factor [Burkholderiales bacterium]TAG83580.1 MAG: sigma-70 family RNA polymerase sigma factor [Betaproteobacteria bacterium]